ncbi:hypothetical protein C4D60_Mb03t04670 [Musa balbisiana]|uniref:Uncharacterized protein n=1 Tax=Musa balbisiana TaxID=52838 RepID=A0A4S8J7J1_MUSBA|nr:hypothetical protein C4D60_Mb03t04670 [Musa balbisiana]
MGTLTILEIGKPKIDGADLSRGLVANWFAQLIRCLRCRNALIREVACVAAKGEETPDCHKFAKYYRSLCPVEWLLIVSTRCIIVDMTKDQIIVY